MADQTNTESKTVASSGDLVMNILSRLPVRELFQFTLVSKHWCSLIKDHIARLISQPAATITTDHYILVTHKGSSDEHLLSVFADDGDYDLYCKVKIPFGIHFETAHIVGSCNGLVCLTDQNSCYVQDVCKDEGEDCCGEVYLFNPVIGKLKTLDVVQGSCLYKYYFRDYFITAVLGFGYCKPDEDFRVVRILYLDHPICDEIVGPVVEVYSLKSEKWREVKARINLTMFRYCNAFVDGRIYWLAAHSADTQISWVVWFDLKDEVFHRVKMPEKCVKVKMSENYGLVNIVRLNGEVAVVGASEEDGVQNKIKCGVWVLKKVHGGKLCWEKKFTLTLQDPQCGIPVGFSWSGEVVVGFSWSGEVVISRRQVNAELTKILAENPNDRKFKYLAVDGPHAVATCFEESLVLFLD